MKRLLFIRKLMNRAFTMSMEHATWSEYAKCPFIQPKDMPTKFLKFLYQTKLSKNCVQKRQKKYFLLMLPTLNVVLKFQKQKYYSKQNVSKVKPVSATF